MESRWKERKGGSHLRKIVWIGLNSEMFFLRMELKVDCLKLIKEELDGNKIHMKINGVFSKYFNTEQIIRQWCVVSTWMLNKYIHKGCLRAVVVVGLKINRSQKSWQMFLRRKMERIVANSKTLAARIRTVQFIQSKENIY